jgi:hypothetical protein
MAVVNHAQTVSGIRIRDIPGARRFNVVVRKFSEVSREATQKMAILIIQRVCPSPCPGPAISPKALSGA